MLTASGVVVFGARADDEERPIELPETLATQAKKAGLLEREALERMVREALLANRVDAVGMNERWARERPARLERDVTGSVMVLLHHVGRDVPQF